MNNNILSYDVITKTNPDKTIDVYIRRIENLNDISGNDMFVHYSVDLNINKAEMKGYLTKQKIENPSPTQQQQQQQEQPTGGRKKKTQKRKREGLKTIKIRK